MKMVLRCWKLIESWETCKILDSDNFYLISKVNDICEEIKNDNLSHWFHIYELQMNLKVSKIGKKKKKKTGELHVDIKQNFQQTRS